MSIPENPENHGPSVPGATTVPQDDLPPRLGKYTVLKRIGVGGMGEVWLAADQFGNQVAIKQGGSGIRLAEREMKRFMKEAHALSLLQHRNICRLYGVEIHDGRPYIIMEFVQGASLSSLLRYLSSSTVTANPATRTKATDIGTIIEQIERSETGTAPGIIVDDPGRREGPGVRLPLQQSLSVIIRLCEAVQYAHERGIFHRDIKPSNIIIRKDGEPVLLDFISINKQAGPSMVTNAALSAVSTGQDITVMFQRTGRRISLYVNGRKQKQIVDNIPFWDPRYGRIGFLCYSPVYIQSIEVHRMSLPRKTTPLVAGEALAASGAFRAAVDVNVKIAADYPGSRLAEQALVDAYFAVNEIAGEQSAFTAESLYGAFCESFPRSPLRQVLEEKRLSQLWRKGDYEKVLWVLPAHMVNWPSSALPLELQNSSAVPLLSEEQKNVVFKQVLKMSAPASVNLDRTNQATLEKLAGSNASILSCTYSGLTHVRPLQGLPLRSAMLNNNRITDISPLAGAPLRFLDISNNRIGDLSPLRGTPLMRINCSGNNIVTLAPLRSTCLGVIAATDNHISDLSPLSDCPLVRCEMYSNDISDISPLAGKKLTTLGLGNNRVRDLSPVAGAPLEVVDVARNPVADLRPLAGAPITGLQVNATEITDLEFTRGMPLKILTLVGTDVHSLGPLRGKRLIDIDFSECPVSDLEPLRGMPLVSVRCSRCSIVSLEPLGDCPDLAYLSCEDNPLKSLGPLAERPPSVFHYYSDSLPQEELRRAFALWEKDAGYRRHIDYYHITRALRSGSYEDLKRFSVPFDGRRYLFMPVGESWEDASEISRKAGGHLLTVTSSQEQEFVDRSAPQAESYFWLGVTGTADGRPEWTTGEPVAYLENSLLRNDKSGHWVIRTGGMVMYWPDFSKCNYIIEWER